MPLMGKKLRGYGRLLQDSGEDEDNPLSKRQRLHKLVDPSVQPTQRKVSVRQLIRSIGEVGGPFFMNRRTGFAAWTMLIVVLASVFAIAYLMLMVTQELGVLTDAMVAGEKDKFYSGVHTILVYVAFIVPLVILMYTVKGVLSLEWRRFLTKHLLENYVGSSKAYYHLKIRGSDIDNPDQRIGQDVQEFTQNVPDVLLVLLQAVVTIFAQSGQLISVDVMLFVYVLLYGLVLTVLSLCIFGAALLRLNRKILAQEASFRFGMVRIREHAEAIAFLDGEVHENAVCKFLFKSVLKTWYLRLCVSVPLGTVLAMSEAGARILPYVILADRFFNGEISFGSVTIAATVFHMLSSAFTTIVTILPQAANVGAQACRMQELWDAVCKGKLHADADETNPDEPNEANENGIEHVEISREDRVKSKSLVRLTDLTVQPVAQEVPLVRELTLELEKGDALMICGPSGIGKSSLFRVLGQLWRRGHGRVEICNRDEVLFLPQEPYLCLGSLADNATYPQPPPENLNTIRAALESLHLGHLSERFGMKDTVDLDTVLSQGEKQRLAFIRLLMRDRVRLALLDEATSAQDDDNENNLYSILQGSVDSFISIAHKLNLEKFHTQRLTLTKRAEGGCDWTLTPILHPTSGLKKACALSCSAGSRAVTRQLFST